jgi:tetratricopeptide (TPR) repeat protein
MMRAIAFVAIISLDFAASNVSAVPTAFELCTRSDVVRAEMRVLSCTAALKDGGEGKFFSTALVYERRAQGHLDADEYLLAAQDYQLSLEHYVGDQAVKEQALLGLGVAQALLGEYTRAEAAFDEAEKVNPTDAKVRALQNLLDTRKIFRPGVMPELLRHMKVILNGKGFQQIPPRTPGRSN